MSHFFTLALESVRDAVRRRIVLAVVALSLLSLLTVDGCTACAAGGINVNGQRIDEMAGVSGVLLFTMIGLWICTLGGVLAADHLQQTIEDGSANLSLSRPVSRASFALARLAGALAVALGAGLVLLGATTFFLSTRSALAIEPALLGALYIALGTITTAALAMTASLHLPRIATLLLVVGSVGVIAYANLYALVPKEGPPEVGLLFWIDRLGPPLAKGVVAALDAWVPMVAVGVPQIDVGAPLLIWTGLACGALVAAFRRTELGR